MSAKTEAIAALCQLLSLGDEADHCYASRTLGVLQDSAALPALIEILHDEDPDVCIDAAEALGRIGNPEAISPLLELLHNHPDGEVRTAAVEALGNFTTPEATSALMTVAVGRPENLAWDEEWDDWWDMQLHAVKALGRMRATEAIPVLQHILEDEESQGIEAEVLTALVHIGGKGLKVIEQRLVNGTARERRRTAAILGHANSKEAHSLLGHALLDKDSDVRSVGIQAIGAANASRYLKAVLISLKDPESEVRNAAIETSALLASGSRHNDNITDQLIPLLDDQHPLVRATTIKTLTTLASRYPPAPEVIKQICRELHDHDPAVATAACHFLAQHKTPQAKSDLLQIAANRKTGVYLRQQAIHALGTTGDTGKDVLDILTNAISDKEQPIRLESLTTLMKLAASDTTGADTALNIIINTLHGQPEPETDSTSRKSAQNAVSINNSPQSPGNLAENLSDETGWKPVNSTLEAISNASTKTVPVKKPSSNAANHQDEPASGIQEYIDLAEKNAFLSTRNRPNVASDIRILSARVLAGSSKPEVIEALVENLGSNEPGLRKEAAISIGRIASRLADTSILKNLLKPLLTQLESGDKKMRHACMRTLAKLGCAEALPYLLDALEDEAAQVRIEAINALVELSRTLGKNGMAGTASPAEILEYIQVRLKDPANGVRLTAAKALSSLLYQVDRKQYEKNVIESIITAARTDNGSQAREMGRILRKTNIDICIKTLLPQLKILHNSHERRFVIELLEEILMPEKNFLDPV